MSLVIYDYYGVVAISVFLLLIATVLPGRL